MEKLEGECIREDAWAYTPEHLAQVQRAREDARAGRTVAVHGDDLARIAELPDEGFDAEVARLRRDAASAGKREGENECLS